MQLTQNEWLAAVAAAATKQELLEYVRVYLSDHAADQRLVPSSCRPRAVRDLRELTDIAFALNQASLGAVGNNPNESLDRFAKFFSAAAQRAAVLSSVAPARPHVREGLED